MFPKPVRILLQTTIVPTADDWSIARFSLLARHLASLPSVSRATASGSAAVDAANAPLMEVVARDRATPAGVDDPVLARLDESDFDELWLFAVDVGNGLTANECAAICRFRARGGGMLVTRDHMDLGSSLCSLGGLARAHYFHTRNADPDDSRHQNDDRETSSISWPNYHSGANGDFQNVVAVQPGHPLLRDRNEPDGVLRYLPSHPHEGGVGVPPDDPSASVIATGASIVTGRPFNLIVAFEPGVGGRPGAGIAESSFHHFCDYNWDTSMGRPSFVTEPPGDAMKREPAARRSIETYVENVARWLAGP
ncbi:MAG TPA: hypothetical protein VGO53_08775 [Steroidobacteraceae bacterium]|nr:hypothetical protein [Steroidobacteraceae bacterium]